MHPNASNSLYFNAFSLSNGNIVALPVQEDTKSLNGSKNQLPVVFNNQTLIQLSSSNANKKIAVFNNTLAPTTTTLSLVGNLKVGDTFTIIMFIPGTPGSPVNFVNNTPLPITFSIQFLNTNGSSGTAPAEIVQPGNIVLSLSDVDVSSVVYDLTVYQTSPNVRIGGTAYFE